MISQSEIITLVIDYHRSGFQTFKWYYLKQVQKYWRAYLRVCQNVRIPRHKTFDGIAGRSRSSTGWFYGLKLHLVVDDKGNIISLLLGTVKEKTAQQIFRPFPYLKI